ncbi:glycosyltransferase family 8 protein [Hymenobacter cheonanensis]|uniref:glycosyltransferase family 8 protein n=1 Tax=Hymenobacter sp. CA2-7 TaxID=3063993 RepID=UPI0027134C26|nr:glycosyltransferase family 8 protein [Hymenobacter sp. CA2-7]MDO7884401.1 glycosyltransferase family 8 protein [Hymenobacter sp. CA2-7]
MNIALAFDKTYTAPFFAAVASIIENNKTESISFHVIASGLTTIEHQEIEKFILDSKAKIKFYTIDEDNIKKLFIHKDSHFSSPAIFYRLFFAHLIPQDIEKILYVDVDTIILKSLHELFAIDMQAFPVAAVKDAWPYDHSSLGISEEDGYFNSGVLLINTEEWRKQKIVERTLEFISNHERLLSMPDQDALNSILVGNWLKLDKKYNLQFNYIPNPVNKFELNKLIAQTVIVHYTTASKPWIRGCVNRMRDLYFYYIDKTPYRDKPRFFNTQSSGAGFYRASVVYIKEYYTDSEWLMHIWRSVKKTVNVFK